MSRRQCNTNARLLHGLSLLEAEEAQYVESFFDRCIEGLRREDRALAQVGELRAMLRCGLGVHHAGLLPLLKEIVEMLFTTGYVKLLFATETFAIGVNMPAKAVCFCGLVKFDGSSERYFLPSE